MKDPEKTIFINNEAALNTNEVMHDYEFYLKMFVEDLKMDLE
jgi:hypothetical protein